MAERVKVITASQGHPTLIPRTSTEGGKNGKRSSDLHKSTVACAPTLIHKTKQKEGNAKKGTLSYSCTLQPEDKEVGEIAAHH